jgi:hypothetical protein
VELGRGTAQAIVSEAAATGSLRDALLADERVRLAPAELDGLLDPSQALGGAELLVDRALARYAEEANR